MITTTSRRKGTKTLVSLSIIAIAVYVGFTPLFEVVSNEVTKAIVTSAFSVIFVIILTMFLLNKQTELEQESKRSEKVFDEKVKVYQETLKSIREILNDGKINSEEIAQLPFALINLQMLGADKIIESYSVIYEKIVEICRENDEIEVELSDTRKIEIFKCVSDFALECRVDLDLSKHLLDSALFERTINTVARGNDTVTNKRDKAQYSFEGKSYGKSRLVHAVIADYVAKHGNTTHDKLKEIFPDRLQGKHVFVKKQYADEIHEKSGSKRHFIKDNEVILLSDSPIAVSNQWGIQNIKQFVDHCRDVLNINIQSV
jgi:hypothetical protein